MPEIGLKVQVFILKTRKWTSRYSSRYSTNQRIYFKNISRHTDDNLKWDYCRIWCGCSIINLWCNLHRLNWYWSNAVCKWNTFGDRSTGESSETNKWRSLLQSSCDFHLISGWPMAASFPGRKLLEILCTTMPYAILLCTRLTIRFQWVWNIILLNVFTCNTVT